MKITKSLLKKIIEEEILRESRYMDQFEEREPANPRGFYDVGIDDDRLQKLRLFFSGGGIKPLVNLTDMEKSYIMQMQGETPEVRKYFSSTYPLLEFPISPYSAMRLAWNDFVEEEGLREIPDLKEKIENHGPEMGYQNKLHIGKIGRIYTGKGGDYLYDHIKKNKLLPKLKAKMFDYLKRYTNPSQIPKRLTLKRGIDRYQNIHIRPS